MTFSFLATAGGLSDVLQAAISQVQQLCDSRGASLQVFDLCQEAGRQSDAEERVARIFLPTLTRKSESRVQGAGCLLKKRPRAVRQSLQPIWYRQA